MLILAIIFWFSLGVLFYSYIGYGILLTIIVKLRKLKDSKINQAADDSETFEPEVTLLIAAYNESDIIERKVANSLSLDYPKDKLTILFVTDGSTDGTPEILKKYKEVLVLHEDKRAGKVGAINRGMKFVNTPIVVFSDANTMINKSAIKELVKHYRDSLVGAVSGEKRIMVGEKERASGAGEGMYWKYESYLKKMDSELYSLVGAAGELFSIRTELFEDVESDTILDDFIISLRIATKGYRVVYEPNAYAYETPSASIGEELKRKIRICAGGFQSIVRLKALLNPFRYSVLSFQYISHRVLRWAFDPFALVLIFPINLILMFSNGGVYAGLFWAQVIFYAFSLFGWYYEKNKIKFKPFFVPYYFSIMNLAAIIGFYRYIKGKQSAVWEKSIRTQVS